MKLLSNGWLTGVSHVPSPNFNGRPCEVDMLVIHCISLPEGQYGHEHVNQLFTNTLDCSDEFSSLEGLKVSAHLFIDRTGGVTQFVSLNDRAWHAGVSSFKGRENCNDFSIGIELEGTDHTPFEAAQYDTLKKLVLLIQQAYPLITQERIVGHSDIAPGRKTDPGAKFDWSLV